MVRPTAEHNQKHPFGAQSIFCDEMNSGDYGSEFEYDSEEEKNRYK